MKLTLNPELKWIAMDKSGCTYLYKEMPDGKMDNRWNGEREMGITSRLFNIPDLGPWEESLHEIMPDGTLRKYVLLTKLAMDTKVLVMQAEQYEWIPRHFAKFDEDGRIRCWEDGTTSFTGRDTVAYQYWKLYEDGEK